ncbi:4Fe-4S binding protein [Nonomuraea sp. NPDC049725]|uniref:NuoI/complex I 23 kDa subunit family protein n=1 Tax=Nonomuraea sp. NPDC049725 TaxID=3154508 RepID=UPI0034485192
MARIPGVGLAKGLTITLRHMLRKSVTQQYPEVKPALPPRSRGVIALVEENCTSCMLCARECPDWCIYIDSHKETIPAPEGGRARQRNVLDRFAIDFALCMYCGICIEVCPFDALFWSPEFEYAEGDIRNLLHEKDRLATWVETVPPPPAHDPGAEPPKELTAAPRRPAREPAAPRARTGGAEATRPGAAGSADKPGATGTPGASPEAPETSDGPSGTARTPGAARPGTPGAPDAGPGRPAGRGDASGEAAVPSGRPQPGDAESSQVTGGAAPARDAGDTPRSEAGASRQDTTGTAPQEAPEQPTPGAGTPPGQDQPARGRPRRSMANVRGIRPPGALPSRPESPTPDKPGPETDETAARHPAPGEPPARPPAAGQTSAPAPTGEETAPGSAEGEAPAAGSAEGEAPATPGAGTGSSSDRDATGDAPGGGDSSTGEAATGEASSTGAPAEGEFSTGAEEPGPASGPRGQTSGTSPRRRRMADPRSIRPPGRLDPDQSRETEEE